MESLSSEFQKSELNNLLKAKLFIPHPHNIFLPFTHKHMFTTTAIILYFSCSSCLEPSSEIKQVTRSLGMMEEIDEILENEVSTLDDCFDDMKKVTYGSRVVAKLVDDVSCDDPRYEGICEELMTQGRVIDEDSCQSEG